MDVLYVLYALGVLLKSAKSPNPILKEKKFLFVLIKYKTVHKLAKHIPIILNSANGNLTKVGLSSPADEYLAKTISLTGTS